MGTIVSGPCWCRLTIPDETLYARTPGSSLGFFPERVAPCDFVVDFITSLVDGHAEGVPLDEGPHARSFHCEGHEVLNPENPATADVSYGFTVDNTPPAASITSPGEGEILSPSSVTIAGTIFDNGRVESLTYGIMEGLATINQGSSGQVRPPNGAWSSDQSILFGSGPRTWRLSLGVGAVDGAGNHVGPDPCDPSSCTEPYDRSDPSLRRSFIVDGTPPVVAVSSPARDSTTPRFEGIAGAAADDIELASFQISVRENLTGLFWSGEFFSSTASVSISLTPDAIGHWSYSVLTATSLINGTSYTIIAQGTDSVGNVSALVFSTFTYDRCAFGNEPTFSARGKWADVSTSTTLGCVAVNCGRTAVPVGDPPTFEFPQMTNLQLAQGISARCEDPNRQCPLAQPEAMPGGAFGALLSGLGGGRVTGQGAGFRCLAGEDIRAAFGGKVVGAGPFDLGSGNGMGEARVVESPTGSVFLLFIFFGAPGAEAQGRPVVGAPVGALQTIGQCPTAGPGGGPPGVKAELYHLNQALAWAGKTVRELYATARLIASQGGGKKINPDILLGCRAYAAPPKARCTLRTDLSFPIVANRCCYRCTLLDMSFLECGSLDDYGKDLDGITVCKEEI